jgi:hypothetical protein
MQGELEGHGGLVRGRRRHPLARAGIAGADADDARRWAFQKRFAALTAAGLVMPGLGA